MTKMEIVMICRTMIPLSGPASGVNVQANYKGGAGKGICLQS